MRIFEKARQICGKETLEACMAGDAALLPVDSANREGRDRLIAEVIEARQAEQTAAFKLWDLARTRAAAKNGADATHYFDQAATKQELKALQDLALHKWDKTNDNWRKDFASPDDARAVEQVLAIVLTARKANMTARTLSEGKTLIVPVRDKEFHRVCADETSLTLSF